MNTLMRLIIAAIIVLTTVGTAQQVWAASFSVAPVRITLNAEHRTERLAVKNESDSPLTLLIKAYHWTQIDGGKDTYAETAELIIFPRVLTLAAQEERFIRVGITIPAGALEHAFRLYLEEQPVTYENTREGATGRILMRVGIPVFAEPRTPQPELKITDVALKKSLLHFTLTNSGNSFVMAEQITVSAFDATGVELFARNLGGFYLLAENIRTFETEIPAEQCSRVARISVTARHTGKEEQSILSPPFGACKR